MNKHTGIQMHGPAAAFDPARELNELLAEIVRLRIELTQGREISTTSLYERVDILCQILTTLPPVEARAQTALLAKTIHLLDEVEDMITNRFRVMSPRTTPRPRLNGE